MNARADTVGMPAPAFTQGIPGCQRGRLTRGWPHRTLRGPSQASYCDPQDEGLGGSYEEPSVVGDAAAVGEQLAGVLEDDDTVAEESPALFGVVGDEACSVVVGGIRRWARRTVLTHRGFIPSHWWY
ncbi:hypothetical protein GCM10023195_20530 [Actinoallomurus liliacearum]|uniref:Uncharacterized protein n=1 Tax=Actinoallomurus liliacearum TaxID=1080073 RepID=A0ABP8THC2_9ACTN